MNPSEKNNGQYISPEAMVYKVEPHGVVCYSPSNEKVTQTDSEW